MESCFVCPSRCVDTTLNRLGRAIPWGTGPLTAQKYQGPRAGGIMGKRVLNPSLTQNGLCLYREVRQEVGDSGKEILNSYQKEPGKGRKRVAGDETFWESCQLSVRQVPAETEVLSDRQGLAPPPGGWRIKRLCVTRTLSLENFCPRKSLTKMKDFFSATGFFSTC